jgi:hypothetical protein
VLNADMVDCLHRKATAIHECKVRL